MSMMLVLVTLAGQLQEGPEPKDVKAGWTAFVIFLLLIAAVAFLMFSMRKQLRKAQAAKEAGVYGDDEEPVEHPSKPHAD